MSRLIKYWLAISILFSIASAQFPKHSKSIDGNINWSKMSYDGKDLGSLLVFAPSCGYFVWNNIEINTSISLSRFSYEGESESSGTIGIGVDYYRNFRSITGYIGGALNFEDIVTIDSGNMELGILYGLNKHVYLDLGFDYLVGFGNNKLSTQTIGIGTFVVF